MIPPSLTSRGKSPRRSPRTARRAMAWPRRLSAPSSATTWAAPSSGMPWAGGSKTTTPRRRTRRSGCGARPTTGLELL